MVALVHSSARDGLERQEEFRQIVKLRDGYVGMEGRITLYGSSPIQILSCVGDSHFTNSLIGTVPV